MVYDFAEQDLKTEPVTPQFKSCLSIRDRDGDVV
jgi:hypothetical protein